MTPLRFSWPFKKTEPVVPPTFSKEELAHVQAFNQGYTLAMTQGLSQLQETLWQQAMTLAVQQLEPLLQQRLQEAEKAHLRDTVALQEKRRDLLQKKSHTQTAEDLDRYSHYLEALDWMLNEHDSRSD